MSTNREEKKEIRRILLGKTLLSEDGSISAMSSGQHRLPLGISDGAGATRFLGVGRKAKVLESTLTPEQTLQKGRKIMADIGRSLQLSSQPEAAACLIRYVLTRPAVLTLEYQDELLVLSAWAGRGLTVFLARRRALKAFIKRMPDSITLSTARMPEQKEEKKKKRSRKNKKKTRAGEDVSMEEGGFAEAPDAQAQESQTGGTQ